MWTLTAIGFVIRGVVLLPWVLVRALAEWLWKRWILLRLAAFFAVRGARAVRVRRIPLGRDAANEQSAPPRSPLTDTTA